MATLAGRGRIRLEGKGRLSPEARFHLAAGRCREKIPHEIWVALDDLAKYRAGIDYWVLESPLLEKWVHRLQPFKDALKEHRRRLRLSRSRARKRRKVQRKLRSLDHRNDRKKRRYAERVQRAAR